LHKPAIDFSGQAALATGASHGIASASNGCFGEIFCAARRTLLQLRANAASAMAVPAKVRFVRISVIWGKSLKVCFADKTAIRDIRTSG